MQAAVDVHRHNRDGKAAKAEGRGGAEVMAAAPVGQTEVAVARTVFTAQGSAQRRDARSHSSRSIGRNRIDAPGTGSSFRQSIEPPWMALGSRRSTCCGRPPILCQAPLPHGVVAPWRPPAGVVAGRSRSVVRRRALAISGPSHPPSICFEPSAWSRPFRWRRSFTYRTPPERIPTPARTRRHAASALRGLQMISRSVNPDSPVGYCGVTSDKTTLAVVRRPTAPLRFFILFPRALTCV